MIQHSNDFETPVRPTVEDESRSIPVTVPGQSETAAETEGSSEIAFVSCFNRSLTVPYICSNTYQCCTMCSYCVLFHDNQLY